MTDTFQLKPKQQEAKRLAQSNARFILFRGGSRSGKTFSTCYFILLRALSAPGSRHGIFRKTAVDCRRTLFDLTFKQVMDAAFPGLWTRLKEARAINDTEMTIELPNGSVILFDGLDDSTRMDRILGNEYSTIFVNEVSQFPRFEVIQQLMSRLSLEKPLELNPTKRMAPKLFLDCNPTTTRHWTFEAFSTRDLGGKPRTRINPIDKRPWPRPDEWAELQMNPSDNAGNISATYLDDLENLSARDRRRFKDGEWQADNDNAIFETAWIADNRLDTRTNALDLKRVIVAVDPAGSSQPGSDETGIIVAGIDDDGHCHILEDCSGVYKPDQWARQAVQAYHRWQADKVIAERNYGGEMVAHTLRTVDGRVPVGTVNASRGKVIRAEPVATQYRDGKVHHCGVFEKLEGQLEEFTIDYDRRRNGSPDRLDALVWAVSELAVSGTRPSGGRSQQVRDFWQ